MIEKNYLAKLKNQSSEIKFLSLFAFVTFILGVWGYCIEGRSLWSAVYGSLQLFVMEYNGSSEPTLILQTSRYLASFILIYAAFRTFYIIALKDLKFLKAKNLKEHNIIIGVGEQGYQLAKNSLLNGRKILIIDPNENNIYAKELEENGAIFIHGYGNDKELLKKISLEKASNIFIVTDKDETNVEISLSILDIIRQTKRYKEFSSAINKEYVYCYVHIFDPNIKNLFKSHEIFTKMDDLLYVKIFNIYEKAADDIVVKYPPTNLKMYFTQKEINCNILLIGFGYVGQSILFSYAKSAHFSVDKKISFTIIDIEANKNKDLFLLNYPFITDYFDLTFIEKDLKLLNQEEIDKLLKYSGKDKFHTIYVCIDDDVFAANFARRMMNYDKTEKIVICLNKRSEFNKLIKETELLKSDKNLPQIIIYDYILEVCKLKNFEEKEIEKIARKIHKLYVDSIYKMKELDPANITEEKKEAIRKELPSFTEWEKLTEEFRESNRNQARHLFIKLGLVGLKAVPLEAKAEEVSLNDNPDLVEIFGILEHNRWVLEKLLNGWKYGPVRDNDRKIHPDIAPYREKDEDTKQKDRNTYLNIPILLKEVGLKIARAD